MTLHLLRQDGLLLLSSMLEELLNNVVPKDVCHELQGIGLDLSKNLFLLIAVGRLQLLLDET